MLTLILLAALGAPGDIMLLVKAPAVILTGPQQTTLGTGIAAQWPGIALSDAMSFYAERAGGIVSSTPMCSLVRDEALDAPTLFGLLVAGTTVAPGLASTSRGKVLAPVQCVATMLTSLGTLAGVVAPGSSAARLLRFDCDRVAAGVACRAQWAKSYTQNAAFTELQAGATLIPLGVE